MYILYNIYIIFILYSVYCKLLHKVQIHVNLLFASLLRKWMKNKITIFFNKVNAWIYFVGKWNFSSKAFKHSFFWILWCKKKREIFAQGVKYRKIQISRSCIILRQWLFVAHVSCNKNVIIVIICSLTEKIKKQNWKYVEITIRK